MNEEVASAEAGAEAEEVIEEGEVAEGMCAQLANVVCRTSTLTPQPATASKSYLADLGWHFLKLAKQLQ